MAGQPTKYKKEYAEQASKLCKLGATDKDLADFFCVAEATINNWKKEHPLFLESIKSAKLDKDQQVERSLLDRAIGYSHPSEKLFCTKNGEVVRVETVEQYPPDPTSMIFWLKNRRPKEWRDKQELEHSGNLTISVNVNKKEKK